MGVVYLHVKYMYGGLFSPREEKFNEDYDLLLTPGSRNRNWLLRLYACVWSIHTIKDDSSCLPYIYFGPYQKKDECHAHYCDIYLDLYQRFYHYSRLLSNTVLQIIKTKKYNL